MKLLFTATALMAVLAVAPMANANGNDAPRKKRVIVEREVRHVYEPRSAYYYEDEFEDDGPIFLSTPFLDLDLFDGRRRFRARHFDRQRIDHHMGRMGHMGHRR